MRIIVQIIGGIIMNDYQNIDKNLHAIWVCTSIFIYYA